MTLRGEGSLNPNIDQYRHQFWLKHGGDEGILDDDPRTGKGGSWIYFADGAAMERSPYGCCKEPPKDPKEVLNIQIVHHTLWLRRFVREFDELKVSVLIASGMHPGPGVPSKLSKKDAKQALKRLQKKVKKRRKILKQLQKELESLKPPAAAKTKPKFDHDFINSVKAMEV